METASTSTTASPATGNDAAAPAPAQTAPATEAAATPTPQAAVTEQQPKPETPVTETDSDDVDYEEWNKGQQATTPKDPSAPEPPDGEESDEEGQPPVGELSDTDKQAIKRHGLDPDEIAALRSLSPQTRAKWIANLDQRAKYTDTLQQQLRDLQGKKPADGDPADQTTEQQPAAQNQQQPTAPADFDAAWKEVEDNFGEYGFGDAVKPIKTAITSYANQAARTAIAQAIEQQLGPALGKILGRIHTDDQAAAFESLELPEGIDKADKAVRDAILKEAETLLSGGFDIQNFNYRHAIPRAAINLYQKQLAAVEKSRKDRARRDSLRQTAEPSVRTPSTAPKLSDDEFEDEALQAVLNGDAKKLEQLQAAG